MRIASQINQEVRKFFIDQFLLRKLYALHVIQAGEQFSVERSKVMTYSYTSIIFSSWLW